jgi:hypothetical protein
LRATDAIVARHLRRANEILRSSRAANQGDLNRSLTEKQRAWDAKKHSMVGVDTLIRDINAFLNAYPYKLSREVQDSLKQARNYLVGKKAEFAELEKSLKP